MTLSMPCAGVHQPHRTGRKAFVPCLHGQNPAEGIQWAMNYVHCMYDAENTQPEKEWTLRGKTSYAPVSSAMTRKHCSEKL